jgi:hypothetical protein
MAEQQQQKAPGGHYSGANPVPTVKKFMESLDVGKKDRDNKVDAGSNAAQPHQAKPTPKKGQKTVTDPVTHNEVVIEDAKRDMVNEVDNPKLSVPNANLGKETVSLVSCCMGCSLTSPVDCQNRKDPIR